MTQLLICHFLIGLPASGKSTFARKLQETIPDAAIISTDTARKELFGKEETQGDWNKVESEVLEQIKNAIASNKPVIYDATNVRRDWRISMLMKIEDKLQGTDAPQVYWVAWHLQTSVDVCKEWNQKRDRKVEDETIEKYADYLAVNLPEGREDFFEIYSISDDDKIKTNIKKQQKECYLKDFSIQEIIARINSSKNRINGYTFHQYSKLLDFERLMHLISLIVNYPGIGNLSLTSPQIIKQLFQSNPEFETDIDEINAFMSHLKGDIYADKRKLKCDLKWLKENLININFKSLNEPLKNIANSHSSDYFVGKTHSHSNLETFSRLIKVIRQVIHGDLMPMSPKSLNVAENMHKLLDASRINKLLKKYAQGELKNDDEDYPLCKLLKQNKDLYDLFVQSENDRQQARLKKGIKDCKSKLIKALVVQMLDCQALELTNAKEENETTTKKGNYIDNVVRYYRQINRTDFPCIKEYQIKPNINMNEGYYFGTGMFSREELNGIYELLKSQSDKQYLSNQLDYLVYQRFSQRLENSKLLQDAHLYPVKVIGSKSIVDFNEDETNKKRFKEFEISIRNSELLEIQILRQPWNPQDPGTIEIYPLQIIFHDQAWHLGYEIFKSNEKEKNGLMAFERIDRLEKSKVLSVRSKNKQLKAFDKLNQLYQASAGIYLGNSVEDQKAYLNPNTRKLVEESFEIYVTELSFKFLGETARRFSKNQMKMSIPLWLSNKDRDRVYSLNKIENQAPHHNKIKLILPKWSIDDIYLIKWLVPWGNEIKVLKPKELVDKIRQRGDGIQQVYESVNLIVCEWDNATLESRKIDGYISIKSAEIAQHQTIKDWSNMHRNLIQVDIEEANQEAKIDESVKLIKRIYKKYKARNYFNILIYCSADKKIANNFAAKIYASISQDNRFEALNISLCSR